MSAPFFPSRDSSVVAVTYPLNYVSPFLAQNDTATPDAEATGDGLSIQGTEARIYAGHLEPNGRVRGKCGSLYLRPGPDSQYQAYLKVTGNGSVGGPADPYGWLPIGNPNKGYTFGLMVDAVAENAAVRYGNVLEDCSPIYGGITVVGLPTLADAIFDIMYSLDFGATWNSIFADGLDNKIIFPQSLSPDDPLQITFDTFLADLVLYAPAMLRVDTLQSGGATGINIDVVMGFVPPSSVSGDGFNMIPLLT